MFTICPWIWLKNFTRRSPSKVEVLTGKISQGKLPEENAKIARLLFVDRSRGEASSKSNLSRRELRDKRSFWVKRSEARTLIAFTIRRSRRIKLSNLREWSQKSSLKSQSSREKVLPNLRAWFHKSSFKGQRFQEESFTKKMSEEWSRLVSRPTIRRIKLSNRANNSRKFHWIAEATDSRLQSNISSTTTRELATFLENLQACFELATFPNTDSISSTSCLLSCRIPDRFFCRANLKLPFLSYRSPIDLQFPRFEKRSCLSPVTIESRFHWTSIKVFPLLAPLGLSNLLSRRFSNVRYGSGDLRGSRLPNLNRGICHHLPTDLFNDEWRGLSTSVEQEDPSSYIAIGFRPNWIRLCKYYGDKPGDPVVSMNRSRLETNRWGRSIGEPHTSGQTLTRYQADTGSDGTKEDDYFWKLCC